MKTKVNQAFDAIINRLSKKERIRNGTVINGSLNVKKFQHLKRSIAAFTKERRNIELCTLKFQDIDKLFLSDYVTYIEEQGHEFGNNGNVKDKLKRLKHVFSESNQSTAIFDSLDTCTNKKREVLKPLNYDIVTKIRNIDRTKYNHNEQLYIDLFLFSCYSGGLSVTEMAALKTSNIENNKLQCERTGTSTMAVMPLLKQSEEIIKRYKERCFADCLLPILTHKHQSHAQQNGRVERLTKHINQTIQQIIDNLDIACKINVNMTRRIYIEKMLSCNIAPECISLFVGCSVSTVLKYYDEMNKRIKID